LTEQNGWPVCSWYLPAGQTVHAAELDTELNWPTMQSVQVRSDVADGAANTLVPAAHTACAAQNVLPLSPWNSDTPQAMQVGAFTVPEYWPGRQSTQRPSKLLELSDSYAPGVHSSFTVQNG
jgi:hypothetical protein